MGEAVTFPGPGERGIWKEDIDIRQVLIGRVRCEASRNGLQKEAT